MSLQTYGWLVLLFPLAGAVADRAHLQAAARPRSTATSARSRSRCRSCAAIGALFALQDLGEEERQVVDRRVGLRGHGRRRRAALAAARPAVDLHGARRVRRLDADPPLLGLLHGVRPRLRALLRVPELLRVQHAAAGPGRELLLPDRRLGVRRRRVLPADLVLVPARDGDAARASRRSSSTWSATSASCSGPTSSSSTIGTLDFLGAFEAAPTRFERNDGDLVAGCLLLLVGAFAKSAQVPLHTWLPDAMEGPTPVSALIHAATMVTAGVYLIARMHPFFEQAPVGGRRRRDRRLR